MTETKNKQTNKGGAAPGSGVQRGLCVLCPEGVTVALLLKGGVDGTKVVGANERGEGASMCNSFEGLSCEDRKR